MLKRAGASLTSLTFFALMGEAVTSKGVVSLGVLDGSCSVGASVVDVMASSSEPPTAVLIAVSAGLEELLFDFCEALAAVPVTATGVGAVEGADLLVFFFCWAPMEGNNVECQSSTALILARAY